jgi:hypothetical protein
MCRIKACARLAYAVWFAKVKLHELIGARVERANDFEGGEMAASLPITANDGAQAWMRQSLFQLDRPRSWAFKLFLPISHAQNSPAQTPNW